MELARIGAQQGTDDTAAPRVHESAPAGSSRVFRRHAHGLRQARRLRLRNARAPRREAVHAAARILISRDAAFGNPAVGQHLPDKRIQRSRRQPDDAVRRRFNALSDGVAVVFLFGQRQQNVKARGLSGSSECGSRAMQSLR